MKLFLLLIISILFLTSCTPTLLVTKSEFNEIPKGAKKVIATVNYPRDSLLKSIAQLFAKDGWPIQTDVPSFSISSTGKSIGSGCFMKPSIYVESLTGGGSRAYLSGQWTLDASGQIVMQAFTNSSNYSYSDIVFNKTGTTKPDIAFQKLLLLAEEIPHVEITFSK